MPQQINLLTPILLAPRRYFSALTLLQATGLLLASGLLAALWLQQRDRSAEAAHQALLAGYASERQALTTARAALPPPLDAATVQQRLLPLLAGNSERQALLQSLVADGKPGQRHSDLLALVGHTLPEQAWLSELRYAPGRLEIIGGTLDTAVLRPWLARLAAHPLLAGQELTALRVDRLGAPGSEQSNHPLLAHGSGIPATTLPVWAFRVVSAPAPAASAASGSTR